MIRSVAVIGLGAMGAPIARRIAAAGFALTACDRDRARLADLPDGVQATDRPEDCTRCDAILLLVATEDQLRRVSGRLAARIDPDRPPLVLVAATVPPDAVRDLAPRLGGRVLDIPVSGGPARAGAGQLTVLAGGAPQDLDSARPLLDSFAGNVFACGPLGAGLGLKLVNNMLCAANITLMAEGFRLAAQLGLDPDLATRALEVSTGRNFLTAGPQSLAEVMAGYSGSRADFDAILAILQKDTGLAGAMATPPEAFPVMQAMADVLSRLGDETWTTWAGLGAGARDKRD